MGPASVRRCARRPAGGRHLPPGQPGASRQSRGHEERRGVPRHARGNRFPHHHDQRPRRTGVGRRRDRGRGGHARTAHVPAAADRDRRARHRRPAGRDDGHRSGADVDADVAGARGRREVHRDLRFTGREDRVDLVERYTKEQGLFRTDADPEPVFSEILDLDLSAVEPSVAGPKRPQDRVPLPGVWESFIEAFRDRMEPDPDPTEVGRLIDEGGAHGGTTEEPDVDTSRRVDPENALPVKLNNAEIRHGSVVIAAITSCTNTSNPTVMIAAGLLARRAVEAGLETKPWVKTSLAPGSRVVTDYLDAAGLQPYLDKLGFSLVGFGCTTCIGNSGPLPDEVASAVQEKDLAVVAVLSGNRNFEGRIHPLVRASYLASPPLCVAYA